MLMTKFSIILWKPRFRVLLYKVFLQYGIPLIIKSNLLNKNINLFYFFYQFFENKNYNKWSKILTQSSLLKFMY